MCQQRVMIEYPRGECVEGGWFEQPHLAQRQTDWTLGLGEAASTSHRQHTLHNIHLPVPPEEHCVCLEAINKKAQRNIN